MVNGIRMSTWGGIGKRGNWTLPRKSDPVLTGCTLKSYKEMGREDIAW